MSGLMKANGRQGRFWSAYNMSITALLLLSWIFLCMYLRLPSDSTFAAVRVGRVMGKHRLATEQQSNKNSELDLGRFGKMMVEMVAKDLPFTIFVPDGPAMQRAVRYCGESSNGSETGNSRSNDSSEEKKNSTTESHNNAVSAESDAHYSGCVAAIVSRIMSFSTVPKQITSHMVPAGGELEMESLSGYKLYLARDPNRGFVVNNHSCKTSDVIMGSLVIHILDGVLMDSMFESSIMYWSDGLD